jgi:hypothetical protein
MTYKNVYSLGTVDYAVGTHCSYASVALAHPECIDFCIDTGKFVRNSLIVFSYSASQTLDP